VWVCVCAPFVMCGYFGNMYTCIYRIICSVFFGIVSFMYEGGPKYFRNLNLPHKRDIVQGSATRYDKRTIF
jgi:hypothetical protein